MVNPARGESQIEIAGRRYTLAFDLNTLCEVEGVLEYDSNHPGSIQQNG